MEEEGSQQATKLKPVFNLFKTASLQCPEKTQEKQTWFQPYGQRLELEAVVLLQGQCSPGPLGTHEQCPRPLSSHRDVLSVNRCSLTSFPCRGYTACQSCWQVEQVSRNPTPEPKVNEETTPYPDPGPGFTPASTTPASHFLPWSHSDRFPPAAAALLTPHPTLSPPSARC